MNAASEFDLGPLTWVKGEIDLALERAKEALAEYEQNGDLTRLKFVRTHVHQVHGALSIVGLDGVTQVTEAFEALLAAIEEGRQEALPAANAAAHQAISDIRQYLDDLMAGEPNQPLRLLPAYQALAAARGQSTCHATDLFYPDLTLRPPKRATRAPVSADEMRNTLKRHRLAYQKGLLAWLKQPAQATTGLDAMRKALAAIEATQDAAAPRNFWWSALGFSEALSAPQIGSDMRAKQLCSRIDTQIRRLIEGSPNIAERIMRDALYFVAQAPAGHSTVVDELRQTFALEQLMPVSRPVVNQPQEAALRRLRETLTTTEELWNKFCSGSQNVLGSFAEHARSCSELATQIGHTDLKRLGQGFAAIANWLAEDSKRLSDTVAMETATAILLLENALDNFRRLGTDFAQQVDLMVARLYGCISGNPVADSGIPLLDEMTRKAQEKLLIGQVGREIQNNLIQIEQTLDGFFRDPSKGLDMATLDGPLKQVAGALTMLGHIGAVADLKSCGEAITRFAQPGYTPVAGDFEDVAKRLSMLGFFIDSLQHGESDYDRYIRKLEGLPDEEVEEEEAPVAFAEPTLETQLEQQKKETQALFEALREAPENEQIKDELKQNLQSLQKDADLVANHELGESAKAALDALETSAILTPDVDAALSGLKPAVAEAPAPSAETLELAQASHEEIDAELLSIFLEEAVDVLATIAEQAAILHDSPHDVEALTTIRRSTHTLKGSGRMVGLRDLGETAWELEQTLNLWLRQELDVNADILRMIDEEHRVFAAWVACLESGQGTPPDTTDLVALAARLRGADTPLPTPAPTAATPPAVEEPAPLGESQEVSEAVELSADFTLENISLGDAPAEPAAEEAADEASDPLIDVDFQLEEENLPAVSDEVSEESAAAAEEISFDLDIPETPTVSEESLADATTLVGMPEDPADQPEELAIPAEEAEVEAAPAATASPTLYDIFCEEARGHLQTLLDSYAALAADPLAPTTFAMTRAAHTFGGIAGTVGLMPIHHLAIALEHALLRRDGSGQPDSIEGLETVRQAIMTLEGMFAGLAEQKAPEEEPQLVAALEEVFHAPQPVTAAAEATAADEETPATTAAEAEPVDATDDLTVAAAATPAPVLPQLTDEIDEQLLPIFLEEAQEQLRELTSLARQWRDSPAADEAPRLLARVLHTFKGNARMAGAMNLGEFSHLLETRVADATREGPAAASRIDEIEGGFDVLAQAVERLLQGERSNLLGEMPVAETAASDESAPQTTPAPAEVAAAVATPAPVENPAVHLPADKEIDEPGADRRATLRVRADLIDRLVNEAGELSIARARIEGEMRGLKGSLLELTENVIRLRRQLRDIEIQAETQIQARVAQTHDGDAQFDPLELDRFTRFQELTRFMAESVNDVASVQQNLLKNLDDTNAAIVAQARLNRSLQQELMSVRMIPFASLSERLYRIVRQTAKDVGKRAVLDIVGGQVEMDRSVLDKMLAPLEHMLRNAITHGIEDQAGRQAAGKREAGDITVSLVQEGNEIILSMADDGKGLDPQRIRTRAVDLGLLEAGQEVDDATLYDFIFRPGFSTATELTQVAGRGVGMDVVKSAVTSLGGRIEIVSQIGKGTTFRLYLPLTTAVTQTLLVRVGNRHYAIPSTMIEQVQELKEKALTALREKGEADWLGNHYPYHFLPHLLGDTSAAPEVHRQYWVLLLRSGSQRVAVQVDELKGNQEVVVKNIGAQLARVVGIDGATVLGDGRVVLILNPVALASRTPLVSVQSVAPAQVVPVAVDTGPKLPTVMVVDDSLTVRKITSRLLTREGYQVILAKDGVDALEQLIDAQPDVILSDIEMPRMDGFDFVRNVRADERLKSLPVIMITSRTADKHRNHALEIGANHYLGKPYDEDELLGLIAGYCKKSG